MKITVVIPTYNEEKNIKKCLTALTKQVVPADEIVVVNNNSTDKTVEIAQKFPVRIVNEKKQGISFARNCGFNAAKYSVIARTDADTVVPRDWVKKIKENFENKEIDALCGTAEIRDIKLVNSQLYNNLYIDLMKLIQGGKGNLVGFNMAISKNIWNKIKDKVEMDNQKVHEDVDLALKVNQYGGKIGYDKTLVVKSSGRRMLKNPISFFIEYPTRQLKTLYYHYTQR
jgi:glycosyltransferase involved in cell wall biosynthesis